jgi:hypothetical protein
LVVAVVANQAVPTDQTANLLSVYVADDVEVLPKMLTQENFVESSN